MARTVFSIPIAVELCGRIASGESLSAICKDTKMPGLKTVYQWLAIGEELQLELSTTGEIKPRGRWKPEQLQPLSRFPGMFKAARDCQAETLRECILETAGDTITGKVEARAARVAIDAYKWLMSRQKPKEYGDLQRHELLADVNIAGDIDKKLHDAIAKAKQARNGR
jgi:hypothetical protein